MSRFKENMAAVRSNPMLMQELTYATLEAQLDGSDEIDIPDASNPFVFAIETAIVNTHMATSEMEAMLRKVYPRAFPAHWTGRRFTRSSPT